MSTSEALLIHAFDLGVQPAQLGMSDPIGARQKALAALALAGWRVCIALQRIGRGHGLLHFEKN